MKKFKTSLNRGLLLALSGTLATPSIYAEDIDLYRNLGGSNANARVMILFDTSGSMKGDINDGLNCFNKSGTTYTSKDCTKFTADEPCYKRALDVVQWMALIDHKRVVAEYLADKDDDYDQDDDDNFPKVQLPSTEEEPKYGDTVKFYTYNAAEKVYRDHNIAVERDSRNGSGQQYFIKAPSCSTSRLTIAKRTIVNLIQKNPDVDFGLTVFHTNQYAEGGTIVAGLGTPHSQIISYINNENMKEGGDTPTAESMLEIYRYLAHENARSSSTNERATDIFSSGNNYQSPFDPVKFPEANNSACGNEINIVVMTDGDPRSDQGENDFIVENIIGSKTGVDVEDDSILTKDKEENYLHQLAWLMQNHDIFRDSTKVDHAKTHTIGFKTGMSYFGERLLSETANLGAGKYHLVQTEDDLVMAFDDVVFEARKANDTFSSPSVIGSQSDRGASHNSVYMNLFLPSDSDGWRGNLKKLVRNGEKLEDKMGTVAVDGTGKIIKEATTYWNATGEADGGDVKLGGVNSHINKLERKLYINNKSDNIVELTLANATSIFTDAKGLATEMGIDESKISEYLNWSMGYSQASASDAKVYRNDVFGDPLHAKPVVFRKNDDKLYILTATNAGYIHLFEDTDPESASGSVIEKWAFMPNELIKNIPSLKDKVALASPEKRAAGTGPGKKYGMDLTPTVYFKDDNGNGLVDGKDKVWAFFGMRRGGNDYYALDVTNVEQPTLMWRAQAKDGFGKLAQTWSQPVVTYINVENYADKPVLVFGGGYDAAKYDNKQNPSNASLGQDIYIVDAESGTLIKSFNVGEHSVAGGIGIFDSDFDGYTDRLYAADLGGNVWRVDMPSAQMSTWSMNKLAALGNRRLFNAPEIARTFYTEVNEVVVNGESTITYKDVPFEAVVIGSGDRTEPTDKVSQDYLYMIQDRKVVTQKNPYSTSDVITEGKLLDITLNGNNIFNNKTGDALTNELKKLSGSLVDAKLGWKMPLAAGEKNLAKATVIGGIAYFPTYDPNAAASDSGDANQCVVMSGGGFMHAMHLHYGLYTYTESRFRVSDTIPDTPQVVFNRLDDGNTEFLLLGMGEEAEDGVLKAKSIKEGLISDTTKKDNFVEDSIGFKTYRNYMYKKETRLHDISEAPKSGGGGDD